MQQLTMEASLKTQMLAMGLPVGFARKAKQEKLNSQLENFGEKMKSDWKGFKSDVNESINEVQVEIEN